MSRPFSLVEFTQLVSTALEIDASLDSRLVYSSSLSSSHAKPALPPTHQSPASSPRVLRKIRSLFLLTSGNGKNQSRAPPSPSLSYSEPLEAISEPSSSSSSPSLKPIPTISLAGVKPHSFVPYLPFADRHERAAGVSIFSRHGSDCGSSIVAPTTPPQSPQARSRVSSTVSLHDSVSRKHSSISSYTTSSTCPSSIKSDPLDAADLDPFAKGQVQVVACQKRAASSYGSSLPSSHSAQPILPVDEADDVSTESSRSLADAASIGGLKPSLRRKRSSISRPKRKPAPLGPLPSLPKCMGPLPLPLKRDPTTDSLPLLPQHNASQKPLPLLPKRKSPTCPLPPLPIDTSFSSSIGLPSPPITPPGSFRDSSAPSTSDATDWTPDMLYTSQGDCPSPRNSNVRGLCRISEIRRRTRQKCEDPSVLPVLESPQVIPQIQRRIDLKPMGHKRTGSPFPLTLARPKSSPDLYIASSITTANSDFRPATAHTFRAPSPQLSLLSCASDASDPLPNVCKHRELMAKEPTGMILGDSGLPIPSIVPALQPQLVTVTGTTTSDLEAEEEEEEEEDMDTPVQSPTTPTAGGFARAQDSPSVTRIDSLAPGLHYKRDRPRQRVPESVFMSPQEALDPFAASDSESLTDTTYWSARSSFTSFSASRGEEML